MYFKFTDPQPEFADLQPEFADPQPEFADPQPEFQESLFRSSQSKDFHQIWAGDPRRKVLHNF